MCRLGLGLWRSVAEQHHPLSHEETSLVGVFVDLEVDVIIRPWQCAVNQMRERSVVSSRSTLDGGCSVYEVGALVFYVVAYMVRWEVGCPRIPRVFTQWSCWMGKYLDKSSIVFVRALRYRRCISHRLLY